MEFTLDIEAKQSLHVKVRLSRWFTPQKLGWYAGDNHVHAQHDQHAAVSTDLNYAALQGRAAGLSFVTEAGSNVSYADIDQLDRRDFLLRYAPEIRPGPYVGHLNTPGIKSVLPHDVWQTLVDSYQLTCERVPLGNAKEMTRRLAECCILDEMCGDEM